MLLFRKLELNLKSKVGGGAFCVIWLWFKSGTCDLLAYISFSRIFVFFYIINTKKRKKGKTITSIAISIQYLIRTLLSIDQMPNFCLKTIDIVKFRQAIKSRSIKRLPWQNSRRTSLWLHGSLTRRTG